MKQLAAARRFAVSLASGALVLCAGKAASAQTYEAIPWGETAAQNGIALRAQVDVMFQPDGDGPVVLMQNAFETGAAGQNMSSEYIFEVLNRAALVGLNEALAKGAQSGRVNVVAICYQYGISGLGAQSLVPMGVFINTTEMQVLPDGTAAFHANVRHVPPAGAGN